MNWDHAVVIVPGYQPRSFEMSKRIRVVRSDPPESTEILAEAIVRIGESLRKLADTGLNEEAIIVLIHDKTKIAKRTIGAVFAAMRQLQGWYCR